ncbi:NACHT domain-containing protein [Rhodovulum sp. BSW8]|uniref:NACHT domain-containing protein n=1 Tax=Rhodovulum sp. BSW8 TaxID=2259645 RepID=UPI001402E432|nr:NACHT domain-containing protein [Rhodovulum sp. BSW8]
MSKEPIAIEPVRASRAGHTFHERWAARRALQLVFPKDDLFAIAVEGLSTNETAELGKEAEDIADLILYYGEGDTFLTCEKLTTLQFKYKTTEAPATSSFLKKTIQKFAASLIGYENKFGKDEVEGKISFSFVTNGAFSDQLWEAIRCLAEGTKPKTTSAQDQYCHLKQWCRAKGVEAERLFPLVEFRASTKDLSAQNRKLHKTLSNWSAGVDSQARMRLHGLEELIREKAGISGQKNNLVKREDVLDALSCEPEDLFPANTEFVDVGAVVEREALAHAGDLIEQSTLPVFIYAEGGVGKTVFVQSLAAHLNQKFEPVLFDCFGGGAYRAEDQSRHLPKIGLLQIVNELASRGLCDPQLPSDGQRDALVRAARKRLEQAASTIKEQSAKLGILVIIDAADNAQLEAENRKEDGFPRLLLASLSREPVEGVKLVLTARPHRMDSVIGKSQVERFELGAFTEAETRAFLEDRRDGLSQLEFSKALARSDGNARVLEYLVKSWEENISETAPRKKITVEELIHRQCDNIFRSLHQAGWADEEVNQFFAAISLLPPPIPLPEMATALGWPVSKIRSAVADLAPMLEVVKHGAIFRDEPTETFIREEYAHETRTQQAIAERLYTSQSTSLYAAEALPHFLVVIGDSDRAYALSVSKEYPADIHSEYGRRRLKLLRLHAAFSLAVRSKDNDRVLHLTMQLAQVAAANAKGDEFIRRSPGVAVCLGDQDTSRRLFQDRSGWRGARDGRLTIAFSFLGEAEEADIHQSRAVRWINWQFQNGREDDSFKRAGPDVFDFSAAVFHSILDGHFEIADHNLESWSFSFAFAVCSQVIKLATQLETLRGINVLDDLANFASSKKCQSIALPLSLLASSHKLLPEQLRRIARSASAKVRGADIDIFEEGYDPEHRQQAALAESALSALIHNSRQSALNIVSAANGERPTSYDYGERHGLFRAWTPILSACIGAWAKGRQLQFHDLLPRDVEVTRKVKSLTNRQDLVAHLEGLTRSRAKGSRKGQKTEVLERRFSRNECENISKGIELVIYLAETFQSIILLRQSPTKSDFHEFLERWLSKLRLDLHRRFEEAHDHLTRNVGLAFAQIFLQHAPKISEEDARTLVDILSGGRFHIGERLETLALMARHPNLHAISGELARKISEDISKDEYIGQRGEQYSRLAEAVLPLGIPEATAYFREGLAQLDQMGGDDYDIIYSLLRYAAEQHGGWIDLALGHRLMNLCQTIFHYDPGKFGWLLFAEAIAQSVGHQGLYKLIRWADQDVAKFSYGLPQLACLLAKKGFLDARRAAFILLLCENEGWHEWKVGDGLRDILEVAEQQDRPTIFRTVFSKLIAEHPFGGSDYLWDSLREALENYPGIASREEMDRFAALSKMARDRTNEEIKRSNGSECSPSFARGSRDEEERQVEEALQELVNSCDIAYPATIDAAIKIIREDRRFIFKASERIIEILRDRCPYEKRCDFILMLPELAELDFADIVILSSGCINLWCDSTLHIAENRNFFIRNIFDLRGVELFDLRYSAIIREIRRLVDFCGDADFILNLVLDTVAREKVELSGDEWLQLATSLCPSASSKANLEALQDLLSGPAAQIGDEIGEGPFKHAFTPANDQRKMMAEITWHLLGDADAFVRWTAARAIKGLADLGLHEDMIELFDGYDRTDAEALKTDGQDASFLNARQWFLMGLARACLFHGEALAYLRERLETLAIREDVHAVNKIHVFRCLEHISGTSLLSPRLTELRNALYEPPKGYAKRGSFPRPGTPKVDFGFDYDFRNHECSSLARLFGLSEAEVLDAIADEIQKTWPDAKCMGCFSGKSQYRHRHTDRYESFRESVAKHALIAAASSLSNTKPVIRNFDDPFDERPWLEWLREHDVSFEDGGWLSDRKDRVPGEAKQYLTVRGKSVEALECEETVLKKLGLAVASSGSWIPLRASWRSSDDVHVRITSALAQPKGIVSQCQTFSRLPDHEIWLPSFSSTGEEDHFEERGEFEPLIWEPDPYTIGIDASDEIATKYAIKRPGLGKRLNEILGLKPDSGRRSWFQKDGKIVLKSQVWGQWRPDPSDHRGWFQDEGLIFWAEPDWLDQALSTLNRRLVLHVDLHKYKSNARFSDDPGLRAVYIALLNKDGTLRTWKARQASKAIY